MTGIGHFCFIWQNTDMKQLSFQSSLLFVPLLSVHIIPSQSLWQPSLPTLLSQYVAPKHCPPRTQTQCPPAFRKARLTLIGCTDPFLWIWIKVRQAAHAKLCQAGPHAHTSDHRVTIRWEEEEREGRSGGKDGGQEWRVRSVGRDSGQGEMREEREARKTEKWQRVVQVSGQKETR